jgi:GntR family transcriptional regulator
MTDDIVQPLKSNRLSLPAQAQKYLFSLVENGTYHPGEQLPSEADLAAQLGISRPTLREALLNLEQEGIVLRKHGVGTFVAPGYKQRLESGLEHLESILELAARQGLQVEVGGLEVQQEPADQELADKLRVTPGTPLTSIRRAIVVDGRPAAYMLDVIPSSIFSPADMDETFNGSVLDLLKQKLDLQIIQAVANIVATNAGSFLSRKLEVNPQQALLLLEETLFDSEGIVVEFSRNYFIPACFHFHVVRR